MLPYLSTCPSAQNILSPYFLPNFLSLNTQFSCHFLQGTFLNFPQTRLSTSVPFSCSTYCTSLSPFNTQYCCNPPSYLSASLKDHALVIFVSYSHPQHFFFLNILDLCSLRLLIHFEDSEAFAYKKGKEITLYCLGGDGLTCCHVTA